MISTITAHHILHSFCKLRIGSISTHWHSPIGFTSTFACWQVFPQLDAQLKSQIVLNLVTSNSYSAEVWTPVVTALKTHNEELQQVLNRFRVERSPVKSILHPPSHTTGVFGTAEKNPSKQRSLIDRPCVGLRKYLKCSKESVQIRWLQSAASQTKQ